MKGWPDAPPTNPGSPRFQIMGLKRQFLRISMSLGVRVAPPPPNKIFSPEDSRKLFSILYGPPGLLPPVLPIVCASVHDPVPATQWKSVKKESITATSVVFTSAKPRVVSSCAVP